MPTLKLNQVIAIEKGVKASAEGAFTTGYREVQKPALLSGIERHYKSKADEGGDVLPPESVKVQLTVGAVLTDVASALTRLFDVTITKDAGNQSAVGNIRIGDELLAGDVPVTTLLMLEKKLVQIKEFVSKLPVLDPAEEWTADANTGVYKTPTSATTRTKKIPRNHVISPATDKHPAQVQVYNEDVIEGYWSTNKFSGAIPATTRRALLERVTKLQEAVQVAREEANSTLVEDQKLGAQIFTYLGW